MISANDINLKKNPFEETTPVPGESIVWAGMPSLKGKIENLYHELLRSNAKKIVLNWGPMGGGKTHAAQYFSSMGRSTTNGVALTSIICEIPVIANDSSKTFIKKIVDSLKIEYIRKEVLHAVNTLGIEKLKAYLITRTRSEVYTEIVIRLFSITSDEVILRYIHNGLAIADLKKLHLPQSLKTDEDYFNFGIALLTCLTASPNRRVVMWIDEMENMIYYQNKFYRIFGKMLREMTDKIAERILIFLNFTLTEPDEETIKLLLGDTLWTVITQKIRFSELSYEDAIIYFKELLSLYQINNQSLSPFNEDAIAAIIKSIPNAYLIPREINKRGACVVNYALENDIREIDKEVASLALQNYLI